MSEIISGKIISAQINRELRTEVDQLKTKGIEPCLAVVLVGEQKANLWRNRYQVHWTQFAGYNNPRRVGDISAKPQLRSSSTRDSLPIPLARRS